MTVTQSTSNITEQSTTASDLAGKYLAFLVGDEMYAVQISKIQEVVKIMEITRVPNMPESLRGVINLRGKVIPVVELRLKFDMPDTAHSERTCIVVVQITRAEQLTDMGIIIDEISEVLNIEADQIEETPSFGGDVNAEFILGIGKLKGKVMILLDIDKVLSENETTADDG